jgi:glutamine amidotransferase
MIAIIDVGLGNPGSIANMLRVTGAAHVRTADVSVVEKADRIILPGVGAFDTGMTKLEQSGLLPILHHRVIHDRVPVLGICLGMQLMTCKSEEGVMQGLAWIEAETRRFVAPTGHNLRIPHMGWNHTSFRQGCQLADGMPAHPKFYYVHSYHVVLKDRNTDLMAWCDHGGEFVAGFLHKNIIGVQFHPEKSHDFGLCLLRNFTRFTIC